MRSRILSLIIVIALIAAGGGGFSRFTHSAPASEPGKARHDNCRLVSHPVRVPLDGGRYPQTAAHIRAAIARGEPRVLHIARDQAAAHRARSLEGIATRPGYDRDEYPMAFSREGGAGADIAYVAYADNRGSGSTIGSELHPYCDGQAFSIAIR
jgi:hypothetical protein